MKNTKKYIIIAVFVILVLLGAYFANENKSKVDVTPAPDMQMQKPISTYSKESENVAEYEPDQEIIKPPEIKINTDAGMDKIDTKPTEEEMLLPLETETAQDSNEEYTCTLSVRCDTILNNMEVLREDKIELVPSDGVIFPTSEVVFYEGESVFNVLLREMKKNKIHMEFKETPIYSSAYIEGIANLYEFDCGELSGWMYRVNGCFPNYGCSRYRLKNGDVIEWIYTCDLGVDIGGGEGSLQWAEE